MNQGIVVAKAIASGNTTGISFGSFKQYRDTVMCIIEANNDIKSRIYAVHDTLGNKIDQFSYHSELGGVSMILIILQCII